jgi:hypothetical protein
VAKRAIQSVSYLISREPGHPCALRDALLHVSGGGTAVGLDLLQDAEQGIGMGHPGEVDDLVGPAQHLCCGLPADRLDAASRQLSVALLAALQSGQQFVGEPAPQSRCAGVVAVQQPAQQRGFVDQRQGETTGAGTLL